MLKTILKTKKYALTVNTNMRILDCSIKSHYFLLLFLVFYTSCKNKEVYTSTSNTIVESSAPTAIDSKQSDRPRALSAEIQNKSNESKNNGLALGGSGRPAIVSAVLTGAAVGISKIFESDVNRTDLNGTCIYGDPDSPITSPCINVTVSLIDSDSSHQVSVTTMTDRKGKFRFYIPEDKKYYIQITDRKGRTASTKSKVGRAAFVDLFLKP